MYLSCLIAELAAWRGLTGLAQPQTWSAAGFDCLVLKSVDTGRTDSERSSCGLLVLWIGRPAHRQLDAVGCRSFQCCKPRAPSSAGWAARPDSTALPFATSAASWVEWVAPASAQTLSAFSSCFAA